MSCTLMYQPYAMPYSSSSCGDRSSASDRQKLFKFPYVPSPPDSSHSGASSYSAHSSSASSSINIPLLSSAPPASASALSGNLSISSLSGGHHSPGSRSTSLNISSSHSSRRSITPSATSTGPSATITSASQQHHQLQSQSHHHNNSTSSSRTSSSSSSAATATTTGQGQGSGGGGGGHHNNNSGGSSDIQHHHLHHPHLHHHHSQHTSSSSSSASATATSSTPTSHIQHHHPQDSQDNHHQQHQSHNHNQSQPGPSGSSGSGSGGSSGGNRAQYLSANCVVYENYDGDSARVVDEHFSRALSASYAADKPVKSLPMSTRNFPPSFWNSAYQPPPKGLTSYGAAGAGADFYGSAMDYGPAISGLAHHHQADPWHHYPLTSHHHHHHQSYHHHHRASELAYPPMPSTSRFTPAQYSSFLFPGTSASSAVAAAAAASGRFPGIPGSASCGVKGEGGHWGAGGRYHPHESTWSDFHLADYSAAAAHYSNMTAGLDFESHYLQSS